MNHWMRVIPFFAFPPEIRRAIYTTNAIESLNMTLRESDDQESTSFPHRFCPDGLSVAMHNIAKMDGCPFQTGSLL
jgi:hypothetical protein